MKLLSKILAYAAVPCLAAVLLISFIDRLSGDKVWIKREYEKLDIAKKYLLPKILSLFRIALIKSPSLFSCII